MERNVVLIEIEGGRVTAYAPAGTLIALHDRDTDGNYGMLCRQKHNEPAFKVLSERLGERECDTPDYVLEILDNPRPFIDWGKEAARMGMLREKAIEALTAACPVGKEVAITVATRHDQLFTKVTTPINATLLVDEYGIAHDLHTIETITIVNILEEIAGGTKA